jgi:hypothetical protein
VQYQYLMPWEMSLLKLFIGVIYRVIYAAHARPSSAREQVVKTEN